MGAQQLNFLAAPGELGRLIRAFDWAATPLGPQQDWPQSLRTSVSLILHARHPMWIGWGEQATFLYNDAYTSRRRRMCWLRCWTGWRASGRGGWCRFRCSKSLAIQSSYKSLTVGDCHPAVFFRLVTHCDLRRAKLACMG
jgi:hypothetical protein